MYFFNPLPISHVFFPKFFHCLIGAATFLEDETKELVQNYKRLSKRKAVVLNKDKHHLLTKFVEIYFHFRPYIAIKPTESEFSKNCQRISPFKRKGKFFASQRTMLEKPYHTEVVKQD